MIRKRTASVLTAFVLIAAFGVSGCKKSNDGVSTKAKENPVEITMYFPGSEQEKDAETVNKAVNDYLKFKINATIKLIQLDWGNYDPKVSAMVSAGEPADIVFIGTRDFNYLDNIKSGGLIELDELLNKYGKNIVEAVGKKNLDGLKINGKLYTIPTNRDMAHNYGLLFNKVLVEKYNFDLSAVKKLEDIEPMLKVIKEQENGIIPFFLKDRMGYCENLLVNYDAIVGNGDISLPGALYADGSEEQKIINQFETPEFKAYCKLMEKWQKLGYASFDPMAGLRNSTEAAEVKAFCTPQQLYPGKAEELSNEKTQWLQVDLTPAITTTGDVNWALYGITKGSKHVEKAVEFLNLLYSDTKLNNMLVYGIEGTHYVLQNGQVKQNTNSGYTGYAGVAWMFGNQFLQYTKVNEEPNKFRNIQAFNAAAKKSPALGFIFKEDEVMTEIKNIQKDNYKYLQLLITGSADTDKLLPEFLTKLKAAGADKVIAEAQRQYDAWKSRK